MNNKKLVPAKPITWAEIKEILSKATDEQLSHAVRWWGDERGGYVNGLEPLDEDYGLDDEGFSPMSTFDDNDDDEKPTFILPKETLILWVDCYDNSETDKIEEVSNA